MKNPKWKLVRMAVALLTTLIQGIKLRVMTMLLFTAYCQWWRDYSHINYCVLPTRVFSFFFLECLISILGAWWAGGGHTVPEISPSVSFLSLLSTSLLLCIFSLSVSFFAPLPPLSLLFLTFLLLLLSLSLIHTFRDKGKNNRSHALSPSTFNWAELHWILFLALSRWSAVVFTVFCYGDWNIKKSNKTVRS